MRKIDAIATYVHYAEHMLPIWLSIPEELRGTFYASKKTERFLKSKKVQAVVFARRNRKVPLSDNLTLVASFRDLKIANMSKRATVYMQHGTGQAFQGSTGGNTGHIPTRHDAVSNTQLYLTPSSYHIDQMAPYTKAPIVPIGCPKLDVWHTQPEKPKSDPPVVALAFHWDRHTFPETRSAWDFYKPHFNLLTDMRDAGEIELLGHGHPLMRDVFMPVYRRHKIPFAKYFTEVLEKADILLNDASSVLFEFASLDRPVVVLNTPWYRKDVEHGLRFWEHANIGIQVDNPETELQAAIRNSLAYDPNKEQRHAAVQAAYEYTDGSCAEKAVEAILEVL